MMSSQLVGTFVQSKFCSSSVMLPTRPASEFTPTPNISRPVCVSSGVITQRQIAKRIAGGRGNHRRLGIAEQVAGRGDLGHGSSCRRARPASRSPVRCWDIRRDTRRAWLAWLQKDRQDLRPENRCSARYCKPARHCRPGRENWRGRVVHQGPRRRLRQRVVLRGLWAVGTIVAGADRRPTLSLQRLRLPPTFARFIASLHDRRARRQVAACGRSNVAVGLRGLHRLLRWRIRLPLGNPSSFGRLLKGPALEGGLRIGRRQAGSVLRRRCTRPLVSCIVVGVAVPRPAVVGRLPIARGQHRRRSTVGRGRRAGRVGVRVRRGRRVVVHRRSSRRLRGGIVLRLPAAGSLVVIVGRRPTL